MDGQAPPSYSGPTQFPTTTSFDFGGDESSNRASMPPPGGSDYSLAPLPQSFQTPQPIFQPPSCPPLSMAFPPRPMHNFSEGGSGSSMPSSVLSMRPPLRATSWALPYSPLSPVVNEDTMTYPPIPYSMFNPSGGSSNLPPRNDNIISGLNSLLAQNNRIQPMPVEMPFGVTRQRRRAANKGFFTQHQLNKIAASDYLRGLLESDPVHLKRLLVNRESAARSKERRVRHAYELEVKVKTLEAQIGALIADLNLEKRQRMERDDECVQLKIRLQGWEEAPIRDALNEHLTGEVHRLTKEASGYREEANRHREEASRHREEIRRLQEEVNEYRRRENERMDANMLEELNINPQFLENPQTDYNFE